jgi:hypothetical protein
MRERRLSAGDRPIHGVFTARELGPKLPSGSERGAIMGAARHGSGLRDRWRRTLSGIYLKIARIGASTRARSRSSKSIQIIASR